MAVFYTYEKNIEEEKMDFLRTLYHDKRGGQMIRLRKKGDQVSQLSTCDMDELAATGTELLDTYTTVQTFRGYKRTSDRVFNFGSIFIDLDCHSDDPDQIQTAKMRTVEILEDAFSDGRLAVPTMITDSGRGFGLQYILDKSIANTWRTEKIKAFYKKVRKNLYEKYQEILSADPQAAQPDASVLDDARVCRIPGTYNAAADTYCRLIGVSGKFYELSELVQGCNLWDWKSDEEYKKAKEEKESKKKEIASRPVVSFAEYKMPFLSTRLEQLEMLQEMRGADCEGCREQMLFIAYSALKQLDPTNAALRLRKMNRRFVDPLPQAELDHIIQETDQSVGIDHRGYYKLSNAYVVDMLALTGEEIKKLGIGQGLRRAADRKAARDKKKEARKKVVELLMQADSLTYAQIAEATGQSRRTICTIAKAEGLMRYAKAAERKNNVETTSKVIVIDSVREGENQVAESAKTATGSVCVSFLVPTGALLTTPSVRGTGGEEFNWYDWLDARASSDAVAREILNIFSWSFCKWSSNTSLSYEIEEYLDRTMIKVMSHPECLTSLRNTVARMLFKHYGIDECAFLFGMHKITDVLPTVWDLFVTAGRKEAKKKRKSVQRSSVRHQKTMNLATETPEQREARINCHLKKYKDDRFDIIESTDEYKRRLDPDVLRTVKIACMQVGRLQREYFWIEKKKVLTSEIKECFNSLTYKDIAVICERIAHQGTIQEATMPFYYVLQTVWKYRHPEAAEAQADRIKEEKSANRFNNFESHTYDFDFGKFMEINAMREIIRQPPLSKEEYMDSLKLIDK